jgi:hypothetical protein
VLAQSRPSLRLRRVHGFPGVPLGVGFVLLPRSRAHRSRRGTDQWCMPHVVGVCPPSTRWPPAAAPVPVPLCQCSLCLAPSELRCPTAGEDCPARRAGAGHSGRGHRGRRPRGPPHSAHTRGCMLLCGGGLCCALLCCAVRLLARDAVRGLAEPTSARHTEHTHPRGTHASGQGGRWTEASGQRMCFHCLPTREGWDDTALGEQRTGRR